MTDKPLKPLPPDDLGDAGRRVWTSTLAAVVENWELDERDLELLGQACRQADLIAELERAVAEHGVVGVGAQGQLRLNSCVTALTNARGLFARLLAQVEVAPPAARTGHLNRTQRHDLRIAGWRARGKAADDGA